MWSQITNVTDRQTDRQTTCDRKTALCTKVHCAVLVGASARGPAFSWVPQQQNPTYASRTNQRSIYIGLHALTSRVFIARIANLLGACGTSTLAPSALADRPTDRHDSPASHSSSTQLKICTVHCTSTVENIVMKCDFSRLHILESVTRLHFSSWSFWPECCIASCVAETNYLPKS